MRSHRAFWAALAALSLVVAACGSVTKSEQYQALLADRDVVAAELDSVVEELAAVTESIDESQADVQAAEAREQTAEENADTAVSDLSEFSDLAEEFIAASLATVSAPDDAECFLTELSLEALFTAALAGIDPDPITAMASIDPTLLGEISAAGLTCGGTGLFNTSVLGTSVFDLELGDCFDDTDFLATEVGTVPTVDCSESHDNEVYFEYSMSEPAFPGDEATLDAGFSRCLDEFNGFVGIDYLDSALDIFPIVPTAESWAEGDRVVYCALYSLDLSKLTGTAQGSRR